MATTEEKINRINKQPCNDNEVAQSITNITNVLNEVNNASVLARCTLTSDNVECDPELLTVSNFIPLVPDWGALGIPDATVARQFLGYATSDSRTGYIIYNWDSEEWEVLNIQKGLRNNYVRTISLDGFEITLPFTTQSVNECGVAGTDVVDFELNTTTLDVVTELAKTASGIEWVEKEIKVFEVGGSSAGLIPTVMRSGLRNIFKLNCTVYMQEREFEVFSSTDDPNDYGAWTYDEEVSMLYNIYLDGGYIWGDFLNITVPCSGLEYSLPLIPVTACTSGSGG
jgi:hypothetical protein